MPEAIRTFPAESGSAVAPQLLQAAELIGNASFALVVDLDETVYDTLMIHWVISTKLIPWILKRHGKPVPQQLPTYTDLAQAGGTVPAYRDVLGNELNLELNRIIRYSRRKQKNLSLVSYEIPSVLAQAREEGFIPALYLTTRPEHVAQASEEDIRARGLPELPLLTRPESTHLSNTTQWKTEQLVTLSQLVPDKTVIMIDNDARLGAHLHWLNNPRIKPLVFQHPMTEMTALPPDVRVATWDSMLDQLRAMKRDMISQPQ